MVEYNKLVRDLIPQIIEQNGQKCTFKTLSKEDFLVFAEKKLDEELQEYHLDKTLEELADLIEVIYALAEVKGFSVNELNYIREKKALERGKFEKKLLLISVE